MPYQLSDINRGLETDPKGFLEQCDAAYQSRIDAAVDRILERMKVSPIVLLSGPSGSGKTTTALKLEQELERRGVNTHTISMDNYFKTLNRKTAPRTPEGNIDFESPTLLDMELLDDTFTRLSRGDWVIVPKFEFARQMRSAIKSSPLRLGPDEIAIFEGIHALNDIITGKNPNAMKLYISARSNVVDEAGETVFKGTWMRLARRTVRDAKFRSWEPEVTIKMWANVRRGEKLYISPFKDNADIQFDSSLPYEVSVIKAFALPLFQKLHLSQGMERYEEIRHLVEAYPKFETLDEKYVAPDSLIREFIGGGIYDD